MKVFPYVLLALGLSALPGIASSAAPQSHENDYASPAEIDGRIQQLLWDQKLTRAQLDAVLAAAGESESDFRLHIRLEIALEKANRSGRH